MTLYPRPERELMAAFNRQQLRELAVEHEVRVIAPVPWVQKLRDAVCVAEFVRNLAGKRREGPTSHEVGYEVEYPTYYYLPRVARHRLGEWYLASVRQTVRRAAREFLPEVLYTCWAHPDGWAAARLGRELGLPVVLKVIGSDLLVVPRDRRRRERVAETLRLVDRVVAVSDDLAEAAVRLGASPEKVSVVREGVDDELFSPGDQAAARERLGIVAGTLRVPSKRKVAGILRMPWQSSHENDLGNGMTRNGTRSVPATLATEKIILFVGNVLLSKGVGVLVEAMKKAEGRRQKAEGREKSSALRCYIVGSGKDEGKVRRMVAREGLEEVVQLVGPCPHARLVDWYRACDVAALPSFSEGVPNVLQEAIACGRPFVATRVGGIPEIAHPSYSRLVSPGDADELAEALEEVLREGTEENTASTEGAIFDSPGCNPGEEGAIPEGAPFHPITWRRSAKLLAEVLDQAVQSPKSKVQSHVLTA